MTTQMNMDTLVTVFGGSGFLGRHVVRALAKQRYRIRVAVRRPELAGHLQPLGRVGQIHAVQANVRDRASVAAAVRGSDVVVNLIGILFEGGRQRFDTVHSAGAEAVALAAAAEHARMIHVSANRRRRKLGCHLWALQGARRTTGAGGDARGDPVPPLDHVRSQSRSSTGLPPWRGSRRCCR